MAFDLFINGVFDLQLRVTAVRYGSGVAAYLYPAEAKEDVIVEMLDDGHRHRLQYVFDKTAGYPLAIGCSTLDAIDKLKNKLHRLSSNLPVAGPSNSITAYVAQFCKSVNNEYIDELLRTYDFNQPFIKSLFGVKE